MCAVGKSRQSLQGLGRALGLTGFTGLRGPKLNADSKRPKPWSAQEQPDAVKSTSAGTGVALYNPENRLLRCDFSRAVGFEHVFSCARFRSGDVSEPKRRGCSQNVVSTGYWNDMHRQIYM